MRRQRISVDDVWSVSDKVPAITSHWSPSGEIPWQPCSCAWTVCVVVADDESSSSVIDGIDAGSNTNIHHTALPTCSESTTFEVHPPDHVVRFQPGCTWDELHTAFRSAAADPTTVTELVLEPGLYELSQNSTACTCPNSPIGIDVCTCTSLFHSEGKEGGVIVRGPDATLRIRCFQAMCGYFGAVCGGTCIRLTFSMVTWQRFYCPRRSTHFRIWRNANSVRVCGVCT